MSLYDGLEIEEKPGGSSERKPDVSGWGSSLKLLETQKALQAKKASLMTMKQKRQQATVAPVMDLKRPGSGNNDKNSDELHFNQQTGKLERRAGIPAQTSPFIASDAPSSLTGVADEYDPLRPNDYEVFSKKRRKQREEEQRREDERRRQERRQDRPEEHDGRSEGRDRRRRRRGGDDSDDEDDDRRSAKRPSGGAAIAPPASLLNEDKQVDSPGHQPLAGQEQSGPEFGFAGSKVALKMMARMGYKEGQGLGKSEQGMSTALFVEKTSKRGGKIIHERDIPKMLEPQAPPRQDLSNANLFKNPSKVILLRNMVGPGEVDSDLEPETAEECQKYGKVTKCVIFEMPGVDEEEAVRIFVEFEAQTSAMKALIDLNGRFFGGRVVKACFFNLDKFRRLDLSGPIE